jgi:hypothetical protein
LYAIWKQAGKGDDYVGEYLASQYGYTKTTEILRRDYEAICTWAQDAGTNEKG